MSVERETKEGALKSLWQMFKTDSIDLYFADETTFSMTPALLSTWQQTGQQIKIFPRRDKKVNLFGIFRHDNVAITYWSEENISAAFSVQSISDICQYLEKPTVLVFDNAPPHCSKLFFQQLQKWEEKGLYIFFSQNTHRI